MKLQTVLKISAFSGLAAGIAACAATSAPAVETVDVAASTVEADAGYEAWLEATGPGDRMPSGRSLGVRSAVVAPNGAAATAHPLATQTALDVLKSGGTAMDAAIAANAMLGLVEPTGNGIGGDLFAIVWDPKTQKLYGYNGSGRSPMGATLAEVQAKADEFMDGEEIPPFGAASVTVPGTVEAWGALHERFGRKPFNTLLEPAIRYAREGAPIPEAIAYYWTFGPKRYQPAYESGMLEEYENAKATYFSPPPREGSLFKNPDLADTLERIAYKGPDEFYTGETAHIMGDYFERIGGALRFEDFAAHDGEWVEPLCATYRDEVKVCELPPNTQGIAALQMLQMLEGFDLRSMGYGSPDSLVAQIEAKRLAFADRARGYADPLYSGIDPNAFLDKERNAAAAAMIDLNRAHPTLPDDWTSVEFEKAAPVAEKRMRLKFCSEEGVCQEFEGAEAEALVEKGTFTACDADGACRDIELPKLNEDVKTGGDGHSRLIRKVQKIVKCDDAGTCTEEVTEDVDLSAADAKLKDGDTTYLTVTDKDGMMVSLIQSNYRGMGSGLVADGLGFMFQDRGQLFSLDPAHPNVWEPGKRPFHTIIPAFAFRKDMPGCQVRAVAAEDACPYEPWMSFGLMGGGMQPQGHVQIILNLVDFDMGLQEAGDAARWEHVGGCEPTDDLEGDVCETDLGTVMLESGIPPASRAELERRGYKVECCQANGGGYQAIMKDFETGAWIAATEMRKDGSADGY